MFAKRFERLWFLYKRGVSPMEFPCSTCSALVTIFHTAFYDWFKKTQGSVVPVGRKEFRKSRFG